MQSLWECSAASPMAIRAVDQAAGVPEDQRGPELAGYTSAVFRSHACAILWCFKIKWRLHVEFVKITDALEILITLLIHSGISYGAPNNASL